MFAPQRRDERLGVGESSRGHGRPYPKLQNIPAYQCPRCKAGLMPHQLDMDQPLILDSRCPECGSRIEMELCGTGETPPPPPVYRILGAEPLPAR
jgi:DNA-directed RNA polymerase subunit RPC12/RpoP